MKRKLAIILAAVMALVCLAGCSGSSLTEDDFAFYDDSGEKLRFTEYDSGVKTSRAHDTDQTSRGIKLGSTLEDVKKAYADVWGSVKIKEVEGSKLYTFQKDKMTLLIGIPESEGTVVTMSILIEP